MPIIGMSHVASVARHLVVIAGISVVLAISGSAQALETNIDRPGGDMDRFWIAKNLPYIAICQKTCQSRQPACKAWTAVNPGVQGPDARCWLKNVVPPPVGNSCCTSGVM